MGRPSLISSPLRPETVVRSLLGVIAVVAIGMTLLELRAVLIPFSVALLLSFIFQPIMVYLKGRWRLPTAIALVVVLVALVLALSLIGYLVYSSAVSLTEAFDRYIPRVYTVVADVEDLVQRAAQSLGIAVSDGALQDFITPQTEFLTDALTRTVGEVLTLFGNSLLVLLFMLFMLAGSGEFSQKVLVAYPEETAQRIVTAMAKIGGRVRQYLIAKTLVSLGTGVLIFLVLVVLGVDFPVFWGFLAFMLNYIPNIGSMVAVVLPFGLSLLQFDTLTIPIIALLLMWLVQMVMGNVVDPRMMAFSLDLSPLLVLVSLIFWGWLWGIMGAVLAVPITSTIKIVFENIDGMRPIAVLMGSSNGNSITAPDDQE